LEQIENARILQQYEYNKSKKDKLELQKKVEEINYTENFVLNNSTKAINEYTKNNKKLKKEQLMEQMKKREMYIQTEE
jgi:arsenate reductase-like glutaredoxin family protein